MHKNGSHPPTQNDDDSIIENVGIFLPFFQEHHLFFQLLLLHLFFFCLYQTFLLKNALKMGLESTSPQSF